MTKELKKCYYNLDLPFSATEEQVKTQEKVLIKIQRAIAFKTGRSRKTRIEKIATSANAIIENLQKNGIPTEKENHFYSSTKEIATQLFVLLAITIVALISFLRLCLG